MKKQSDLNIKIDSHLKEQIEAFSFAQDQSVSEVVRMALRVYLFLVRTKKLITVTNWALEVLSDNEEAAAA